MLDILIGKLSRSFSHGLILRRHCWCQRLSVIYLGMSRIRIFITVISSCHCRRGRRNRLRWMVNLRVINILLLTRWHLNHLWSACSSSSIHTCCCCHFRFSNMCVSHRVISCCWRGNHGRIWWCLGTARGDGCGRFTDRMRLLLHRQIVSLGLSSRGHIVNWVLLIKLMDLVLMLMMVDLRLLL